MLAGLCGTLWARWQIKTYQDVRQHVSRRGLPPDCRGVPPITARLPRISNDYHPITADCQQLPPDCDFIHSCVNLITLVEHVVSNSGNILATIIKACCVCTAGVP